MADPGWLILALKLENKDADYIRRKLFSTSTPGTQPAQGQFTRRAVAAASNLLSAAASGVEAANLFATIIPEDTTPLAFEIECTHANAVGDTVSFTFYQADQVVAALTEGVAFVRGSTNNTCAANLAAAIRANTLLMSLFTVSVAANVVTLTSKTPTIVGLVGVSSTDATAFDVTVLDGTNPAAALVWQQIWANRE